MITNATLEVALLIPYNFNECYASSGFHVSNSMLR